MIVESTTYTSLATRTCSQVQSTRLDMAMNPCALNGSADLGVTDEQKNENRNSIPIHPDHRKSRSNVRFDVSIELRQSLRTRRISSFFIRRHVGGWCILFNDLFLTRNGP